MNVSWEGHKVFMRRIRVRDRATRGRATSVRARIRLGRVTKYSCGNRIDGQDGNRIDI